MSEADLQRELEAARAGALVIRPRERGRIVLTGTDRLPFFHNLTTQDIQGLAPETGAPAVVVNQRGQILDLLDVYARPEALWVVTGPGKAAADLAWWDRYLITEDVTMTELSAETALVYLSGPAAASVLAAAAPDLGELPPYGVGEATLADGRVTVLGTLGLYGPGYYLWGTPEAVAAAEAALLNAGAIALSEPAFEALRVSWGLPAVGSDLTERNNPWEARLDQAISLHKGCYLGQEIVARLNTYDKVQRYLVGFDLPQGGVAAPDDKLFSGEQEVGYLTSVAAQQALGYVKGAFASPDTALTLRGGAGEMPLVVRDRPFWAGKTRPVGPLSKS